MRRLLFVVGAAVCLLAELTPVSAGTRMGDSVPTTPPPPPPEKTAEAKPIALPTPAERSQVSVEEALRRRRSVRDFAAQDLTLPQLGQLLWAAQGITERERGLRTAPSAMAQYPLRVYVVKRDGVFEYRPLGHVLLPRSAADRRDRLCAAAGDQMAIRAAPVNLVITGMPSRLKEQAGPRAERYVYLEAGHAAQNVLLQAVTLGLASVPIGAFDDRAVASALGLPADELPIYILPVGRPAVK